MLRGAIVTAVFISAGALFPGYASATIKIGGASVDYAVPYDYLKYSRYMRVPSTNYTKQAWLDAQGWEQKPPSQWPGLANAIRNTCETDLWAIQLYEGMHSTQEAFSWPTLDDAMREVSLRHSTVMAMEDMNRTKFFWYKGGSRKYTTTASARWGYELEDQRFPNGANTFLLYQRADVANNDAASAINLLCTTGNTDGECFTAICVCIWWGQYAALTSSGFNSKYPSSNWDSRLVTSYALDNKNGYLAKLTRAGVTSDPVYGDWRYLQNGDYAEVIDAFKDVLPKGSYFWSGENYLVSGVRYNQQSQPVEWEYTGLGRTTQNQTADEARSALSRHYNDDLKTVIGRQYRNRQGVNCKVTPMSPNDTSRLVWTKLDRIHN